MRHIRIFDTTLRDGEQSPGVALSLQQKLEIAHALARLNVDIIEAGFPVNGASEFECVSRIAREVQGPVICALARTHKLDIERAAAALEPAERRRIHVFTSASRVHLEYMLKKTPEQILELTDEMVRYARQFTDDVEFSAQDVMRADFDFVLRLYDAAIAAGATTINIPDTTGYGTPPEYGALIKRIHDEVVRGRDVHISAHCHDDLGMATANSLAAVENGATQIECTVNGIGERAGNTALEEVVMALYVRRDHYQAETRINTREIYRISRMVERYTGMVVQPNKAIVGDNAFAHESGIHQDGVIKNKETYEIMNAELVGREAAVLVLGKHSGRAAVKKALHDLGYELDEGQMQTVFQRFREIVDRKGPISTEELRALVESETASSAHLFTIEQLQFFSGYGMLPTATVRLKTPKGEVTTTAIGDGPVDAVYKALAEAIEIQPELELYRVEAVTGTTEALGEVTVKLKLGEVMATGHGISPDIIEASARAYLDAANKLVAGQAAKHPPSLDEVQTKGVER
ncbi:MULTISPECIES: 2-isopropylmalate synthase [unclassified Meiothermus]|uniref:2-isopropylmalate synthase n=1 Tax=unclassified Meiothermus TaxID=370471 RepID=UPI000D7B98DF|nr:MULTISPECIES: 2-isopropylmalate synthase [unclassified Meiothermus]PZA08248.1 2-isopropylmalate synthase [Meiothermus sp. Pnk-1]RYM38990.1 2-isopropylmalate synthase [Meiothermus sp. PNK-Is4]